jgi:hypothetical protein
LKITDILLTNRLTSSIDKELLNLFCYFYFIKASYPWKLTKQSYGCEFDGFIFDNLDELQYGNDDIFDHLCDSVISVNNKPIEQWGVK